MPYVIRLVSLASGRPHPFDGQFLKEYDPGPWNMRLGECVLEVTKNIDLAKIFKTRGSAHDEWIRIDPRMPVRHGDGKPNRPLTAWTVQILSMGENRAG